MLDWSDRVSRKYVSRELGIDMRKFAEPLVKWLREASEEEDNQDSENEDEEDDLEVSVNLMFEFVVFFSLSRFQRILTRCRLSMTTALRPLR